MAASTVGRLVASVIVAATVTMASAPRAAGQTGLTTLWTKKVGPWAGSARFSPDGSLVASETSGFVKVFDTATGASVASVPLPNWFVNAEWSKTGAYLGVCTLNGYYVFETATWSQVLALRLGAYVRGSAFSPDDTMVAIGPADEAVEVYSIPSGAGPLWVSPGGPAGLCWSPVGTPIVTGRSWGPCEMLDATTGASLGTLPQAGEPSPFMSSTGLYVATRDMDLAIWNLPAGTLRWSRAGSFGALGFSPDDTLVGTATDSTIVMFRAADGSHVLTAPKMATGGSGFAFARTGGRIGYTTGGGRLVVAAMQGLNRPPVAEAGPAQTVECTGGLTSVVLNGTGSSDPDGDALTFEWALNGAVVATGPTPTLQLPLGVHELSLKVTDPSGDSSEDRVTVAVVDRTAPAISPVSVDRSSLWPPNHRMVDVALTYSVQDAADPAPQVCLQVSSNEPVNGLGDGDTAPDWEIVDSHHVRLRAERSGSGSGRTYTITVVCLDASGNRSTASATVVVPKSQGR